MSTSIVSTDLVAMGDVRWRQRVRVRGQVRSTRVQPWGGDVPSLECTVVDETGGLTVVFLGRSKVGGVVLGAILEAEGMVAESRERLVMINPVYRLVS